MRLLEAGEVPSIQGEPLRTLLLACEARRRPSGQLRGAGSFPAGKPAQGENPAAAAGLGADLSAYSSADNETRRTRAAWLSVLHLVCCCAASFRVYCGVCTGSLRLRAHLHAAGHAA